ncbi:hypothetical protein [Brevibacillus migulae]|uniref:hypothetical protein n=1 Tax=Brevibacillus migulae TaxID=1644114 RepID=UPI00106EF1AB|nr:hypothetical protein [Brevibacillus migulae]
MEELIELAIALIVKFWPVILAFLGFKALGRLKGDARNKTSTRRPVLTPVHGGGIPQPQPGDVMRSEREETVLPQSDAFSYEETREESAVQAQVWEPTPEAPIETPSVQRSAKEIAAREGMKWAMIFSPPRAKMPYRPHEYQKKQ